MSTNNTDAKRSFPLASLITLVFVTFKVLGVITWSWWIVFCPLYIAAGLYAAVLVVIVAIALAAIVAKER